jgi:colanic acid/amylovoran biosynthesis protein
MNILFESGYANYNWGDASMVHEEIRRLKKLYPEASITLADRASSAVAERHSRVEPLPPGLRRAWRQQRPLWSRLDTVAPGTVDRFATEWAAVWEALGRTKMWMTGRSAETWEAFLRRFDEMDILFVGGGGHLTDAGGLRGAAENMLNLIMHAHSRDLPVFMFGHGVGPFHSDRLREKARRALSGVRLLTVRERAFSYPQAREVGVPEARIAVTGDDAVSFAYRRRPDALGDAIGVNLRVGSDSGVSASASDRVGEALSEAAATLASPLCPVPISHAGPNGQLDADRDTDTIRTILSAAEVDSDGGASLQTVEAVVEQVGRCRVVVTGSYHAGVFALSQGVPVVALYRSEYYNNKLKGLADMFEIGCTVLRADRSDIEEVLEEAVTKAWESAEEVRPRLLDAAEKQVEAADAAYARLEESLA